MKFIANDVRKSWYNPHWRDSLKDSEWKRFLSRLSTFIINRLWRFFISPLERCHMSRLEGFFMCRLDPIIIFIQFIFEYVLFEEDSYEDQPSVLNEPEPLFWKKWSSDPNRDFYKKLSNHLQPSWSNQIIEKHEQLYMSMLDHLASGGNKRESLTSKERGFREQRNGLTRVKCVYCERFQVKGPFGYGEVYKTCKNELLLSTTNLHVSVM